MGKKQEYHSTPVEILPHILSMVSPIHAPMLDPCAGNGEVLDYLARRWSASRFGIEPDKAYYRELEKVGKALEEDFFNCYVRNFKLAYVYPPHDIANPVAWIKQVHLATCEEAIVIWRLPQRIVQMPSAIKAFVTHFEEIEVFKDPPELFDAYKMYTIRCRSKDAKIFSVDEVQEFVTTIEHAPVLGTVLIRDWDTPRYGGTRQFRVRGLEWEDVFEEVAEVWGRLKVPFSSEPFNWNKDSVEYLEAIDNDQPNPKVPIPHLLDGPSVQVWSDGWAVADSGIYMLSMIGRKNALRVMDGALMNSKSLRFSNKRGKLIGGGSKWQENYRHLQGKLPNTGAFMSIWIHNNATCRPDYEMGNTLFIPENNVIASSMLSKISTVPVAPEWMDLVKGRARATYNTSIRGLNGRFLKIQNHILQDLLIEAARNGELPTPSYRVPEIIRPIMPPSAGIWGQFAMQEFINQIPLDNRIMMHAEAIKIHDVDFEETIDGRKEKIEVERKDCVRVTVFHYAGAEAGAIEIYETAKYDEDQDDDNE